MHIEYDVTEQDFLDAQRLVRRMSNSGFLGWAEFASPFLGFVLAAFVIYLSVAKGVVRSIGSWFGVESVLDSHSHTEQKTTPETLQAERTSAWEAFSRC